MNTGRRLINEESWVRESQVVIPAAEEAKAMRLLPVFSGRKSVACEVALQGHAEIQTSCRDY